MENQALNPGKVFASLFFFLERPAFLWVQGYLPTFSPLYLKELVRIITCKGLVKDSEIYFWFHHWFSEDIYSSFMHKSIFLPFPPLIFYCPLNVLKNVHDMHGFLPPQIFIWPLSSVYMSFTPMFIFYGCPPSSTALKAETSSNFSHFLFHFLLYDCHKHFQGSCYACNKYSLNKLIKLLI